MEVIESGVTTISKSKFAIEPNSANSIPFDFSNRKKEKDSVKTTFSYVDSETNTLIKTVTEIEALEGWPGPAANDVWMILLNMGKDLLRDPLVVKKAETLGYLRVHYTLQEIETLLQRENYLKSIRVALKQLRSVKVVFHNLMTGHLEFNNNKLDTNLILRIQTAQKGRHGKGSDNSSKGYADIDWSIMKLFMGGIFGKISREDYIKLKDGAPRKLIQILATNQTIYGDEFFLHLEEVAGLLFLTWPGRATKRIKDYMAEIKNVFPEIRYEVKTFKGRPCLYVNWVRREEIGMADEDPYVGALLSVYGIQVLQEYGLGEVDKIQDLLAKISDGERVKVGKKMIPVEKVVLDIFLWQQTVKGIPRPNFTIKTYLASMVKKLDMPTEWIYCVTLSERKSKEEADKRLVELDEKRRRDEESKRLDEIKFCNDTLIKMRESGDLKHKKIIEQIEYAARLKGKINGHTLYRSEESRILSEIITAEDYDGKINLKPVIEKLERQIERGEFSDELALLN
ncbi:MAG: hypothetical protein K9K67_14240 [Bacteriovoracaceae bacterium]|nr:hypothetical protein [Bacteriovoracaceae bacterium]